MKAQVDPRRVTILALPDFVPFDLSIPFQVFSLATLADGARGYAVDFCGPSPFVASGAFRVGPCNPLSELCLSDTVILPGIGSPLAYRDAAVFAALREAAARGVRIASICTGACVLAAAGLLDGLSATTHWELAKELAEAYPAIAVEPDVLFVDNGSILTSAGLASGLDLCLHMISGDYGVAAGERCAEFFVMPLAREGRYAQRIRRPEAPGRGVGALQVWLLENLHHPLALDDLARQACVSARTLNRKFREQVGVPPMVWLWQARLRRAQSLLESTRMTVEQVAVAAGFDTAAALRARFRREVGASPVAWRKASAMKG